MFSFWKTALEKCCCNFMVICRLQFVVLLNCITQRHVSVFQLTLIDEHTNDHTLNQHFSLSTQANIRTFMDLGRLLY